MSCKSVCQNAVVMLALCACAVFFTNPAPAHAQQFQVLGASPPAQDSAPELTASKRLILHDISISGSGIDPYSQPVLDYAVELLRRDPATVVYVSGQGDRATVRRQARAVAQYLAQHGVAASRLVLRDVPATSPAMAESKGSANTGIIVLNLTTPACAACPS